MKFSDWYTDTVSIYRSKPVKAGALTKHERTPAAGNIPCRVYRSGVSAPRMQATAAYVEQVDKLACDNAVDIQAGDELLITRGGGLGRARQVRAFAGEPVYYYEPFGAVSLGLAHQEVALLRMEYLKGGAEDGGHA